MFKIFVSREAIKAASDVLSSNFIGQGPITDEFESRLRGYFDHPYINTTNSATSAEHLAFQMLKFPNQYTGWRGLTSEDYCLSTPLTCFASHIGPLAGAGLKIKWVDIDPTTLNMDLDDLERKITKETKVINLVHWAGNPNDLHKVKDIQNKTRSMLGFRPEVVEDAAHAFGAKYKGKYIGTHGNLVTFSLQAIKHLTASDGGLLFSPNPGFHARSRNLRWFGINRDDPEKLSLRCDQDIVEAGHKFHMTDLNASIGMANLGHIDGILNTHKANAKFYDENLKGVPGLTLLKRDPDSESTHWIYSILVDHRADFHKWMKECGIACNQVHERTDNHTCMKEFRSHLPNMDKVAGSITNIPVHWAVTEEDRAYIVEKIRMGW